jgi:hypothetical protein
MSYRKNRCEPGWRYEKAQQAALALDELLRLHRITIKPGSPLETHVLRVMKLTYDKEAGTASDDPDVRGTYRTLVGVHELASYILEVKESSSFPSLLPHLRLLNDGASLQNVPSGAGDQATNKLFELFVATLAIQCGSNVTLDDPYTATGDNPDVLATLGRRRWGIACKTLHGVHPEGFMRNLEKGLDQIENSPAEIGVVIFNLKNVLPHDRIWPLAPIPDSGNPPDIGPAAWPDTADPYHILSDSLNNLGNTLVSYLPSDHLDSLFRGRKSIPGFLLWAHFVSGVRIDGRPTPTSVRALNFRSVAPIPTEVNKVLSCLNWAAFLSSPMRGPRPIC